MGEKRGLTAGLKSPPLILKNTQAFTASENPNERLMYRSCAGFFCWTVVTTMSPVFVFDEILATCVPANAKNRKDMVPMSSPITATVWPRTLVGRRRRRFRRPWSRVWELGGSVFILGGAWAMVECDMSFEDERRRDAVVEWPSRP